MLHRLVLAVVAGWLAFAGLHDGAWAQASADQLNKLSLESLTAGPSGGGYRPTPHRGYARRHYARYSPRRSFARHYSRTRYGRIRTRHAYTRHAYADRPHVYARRYPAYHHARRYYR